MKKTTIEDDYKGLQNKLRSSMRYLLKTHGNNGSIEFNEEETKKFRFYTNMDIKKIYLDKNVSGDIAIKYGSGTITAYKVLSTDIQYNIRELLKTFAKYHKVMDKIFG